MALLGRNALDINVSEEDFCLILGYLCSPNRVGLIEAQIPEEKGFKFEADNANHTGKYTLNGQDYGTVTWSSDSSRGGKYFDGDEINFTFTPSASFAACSSEHTAR